MWTILSGLSGLMLGLGLALLYLGMQKITGIIPSFFLCFVMAMGGGLVGMLIGDKIDRFNLKKLKKGGLKMLVFTYGTLLKGQRNHLLLKDCKRVGLGEIHGYVMFNTGNYPAIIKGMNSLNGPNSVKGEVYEIDEAVLLSLDRLEGVPFLYKRKWARVILRNGKTLRAFVYIWARSVKRMQRIGTGDWKAFSREQEKRNRQYVESLLRKKEGENEGE